MSSTALPPQDKPDSAACEHTHGSACPAPLPYSSDQLQAAADMCHAMSDPARLRLLLRLAQAGSALCVSQLVAHEQGKASSISARLQALHAVRLVARRREAKHIYYRLADDHVRALLHNIIQHAAEDHAAAK